MLSSTVSIGDVIIASQYNNLRKDSTLFSFANPVYDGEDRLTQAVINGVTQTFTYDSDGFPLQTYDTVTTGTVVWDTQGRLYSISYA